MPVKISPPTLVAKYELIDELGHGAQAVVYLAKNRETGEHVAIKARPKKELTPKEKDQLLEEIAILSKVNHPNLLRIYEHLEDANFYFLVTELCTGGELFEQIVARERYTEADAQQVVKALASALAYCHSNKIVHRDLKPENILLVDKDDNSSVKIADFGYAREFETENLHSHVGTFAYCAPEILQHKPYDMAVDMWSFGIITFVLLCGYLPFFSENEAVLIKLITAGELTFESPYWDDISADAKDLISQCLKLNPRERITAEAACKHPWLVNEVAEKDITPAIGYLKAMLLRRMIKRTTLTLLAVERFKSLATKSAQD